MIFSFLNLYFKHNSFKNIYSCMMNSRELSFLQKVKNCAFNVRYKLIAYTEEYGKKGLIEPGDKLYILGNEFRATKENSERLTNQIYDKFINTPWLTYRSGFPPLSNEIEGNYVTDTGWGCMIRVGQMAFAQIIKQHRKAETQEEMLEIINLFNDFDKSQPFSIQKISKIARKQFGIMPGDWYNPSQISYILAELHKKYLESVDRLEFIIFNSGNLFYDQLLQAILDKKPIVCNCLNQKQVLVCEKCNRGVKGVALIALTRIGLEYSEVRYLKVLTRMMQIPHFKGIIGGKPKKALYFLGRHNQDYIYLDPHFVQTADKKVEEIKESYFCESFRKCKCTSIDSSIGICFYIANVHQLNEFVIQMNKVKKECSEDFFIFISEKTPSYAKKESKSTAQEEEYFQNL